MRINGLNEGWKVMPDRARHRTVLVKILKDIYSDLELRQVLGFKGGTAAYLFTAGSFSGVDVGSVGVKHLWSMSPIRLWYSMKTDLGPGYCIVVDSERVRLAF